MVKTACIVYRACIHHWVTVCTAPPATHSVNKVSVTTHMLTHSVAVKECTHYYTIMHAVSSVQHTHMSPKTHRFENKTAPNRSDFTHSGTRRSLHDTHWLTCCTRRLRLLRLVCTWWCRCPQTTRRLWVVSSCGSMPPSFSLSRPSLPCSDYTKIVLIRRRVITATTESGYFTSLACRLLFLAEQLWRNSSFTKVN